MKKFKKIYVEITNVCNLSCNFCPKTKRKYDFMSVDKFESIIHKIKGHTKHIYFHLMGEPFLNPNLEAFLKISSENDIKVNITTNGTLINKVKDILINGNVRQINISLHSFEANEEGVDFNEYIDNIISFVKEISDKTSTICTLRLWNKESRYRADNDMNVDILTLLEKEFNVGESIDENLKTRNSYKLKDNVYISMGEKFKWPSKDEEEMNERVFCYGLRDHVGILVDGTVVPCCLDSDGNIPLGNIFETDLQDILDSERAKAMYDGFSQRKAVEELCRKCGFINRVR